MQYETLLFDVEDGIATVTLNRPDKLNAFTRKMAQEVIAVLDRVDSDDAIGAVIFTGAGRAFCAGADVSGGENTFAFGMGNDYMDDLGNEAVRDGGGLVTLRMFDCIKPMIAAVNGPAVGVGATMLLPMDVRLASDTARFGFPFTRRGIVPESCSSWFLPRLVGISQALQWCYKGNVFPAQEALQGGLVNSLHSPEDLLPAARALAHEFIDSTAPVSVAMTRQLLWKMMTAEHPMDAHNIESRGVYVRGRQSDSKEGVKSFLEKRPAQYTDKPSTDMPAFYPWWEPRQYE